jgi:hypothetical protein
MIRIAVRAVCDAVAPDREPLPALVAMCFKASEGSHFVQCAIVEQRIDIRTLQRRNLRVAVVIKSIVFSAY